MKVKMFLMAYIDGMVIYEGIIFLHNLKSFVQRVCSEVFKDSVRLSNGETIACGLVVWSTGLSPRAFTQTLKVEKNREGQVVVVCLFSDVFQANESAFGWTQPCGLSKLSVSSLLSGSRNFRIIEWYMDQCHAMFCHNSLSLACSLSLSCSFLPANPIILITHQYSCCSLVSLLEP